MTLRSFDVTWRYPAAEGPDIAIMPRRWPLAARSMPAAGNLSGEWRSCPYGAAGAFAEREGGSVRPNAGIQAAAASPHAATGDIRYETAPKEAGSRMQSIKPRAIVIAAKPGAFLSIVGEGAQA